MSSGGACRCPERAKAPADRRWFVYKRNHNTSAFNGYRYASSAYSSIKCRACGAVWRTDAGYADLLPDGNLLDLLPDGDLLDRAGPPDEAPAGRDGR